MPDERRAGAVVFVALLSLYLASLAPDVTLWDAGEFNSAIATLGIPHPPGTPLYVLLGRAWSRLLAFTAQAAAVNSLSAVATAGACAVLAALLARWTRSSVAGIAGGLGAGVTFSLWQNATETEVYSLSLLLALCMVAAGDHAGRSSTRGWRLLLVYLIALAIPLQISALVAAPAAILLAASRPGESRPAAGILVSLGGAFLVAVGIGVVSPPILVAGLGAVALAAVLPPTRRNSDAPWRTVPLLVLGASATLFMLIRAAHDPGINQGDPATWHALADVIGRRQYDVPPLWPRRAPLWIQLGNLAQYADWQVAFGLDDGVGPSWLRTPWSVAYGALAIGGARWHWRRDPRSAHAVALLLLAASLGVVCVLNLRAGPSIGAGFVSGDEAHEPRERDYFFAPAFAIAGAWAAVGASALVMKIRLRWTWLGVVIAALPGALNWNAANRRREPQASLAGVLGESLLRSSPPRAVLLLAGDNDSYSTWFAQRVRRLRPDVTPVTLPLLGAEWYRAELGRRDSLLAGSAVDRWLGETATLRAISESAARLGRPLAAAISVSRDTRTALAGKWMMSGMVFVVSPGDAQTVGPDAIDRRASQEIADLISRAIPTLSRPVDDPASSYIARLLSCPGRVLRDASRHEAVTSSLDSLCNFK